MFWNVFPRFKTEGSHKRPSLMRRCKKFQQKICALDDRMYYKAYTDHVERIQAQSEILSTLFH